MTTPDPEDLYRLLAEMEADGAETVIMEATSHALALGKLDALHFDAAIFTNLTPEHLDFHGGS
jgi:UDP-N-acetylmuramoyl-L-alanyl-D-glutamate--2,6-diaminopimelate ligase